MTGKFKVIQRSKKESLSNVLVTCWVVLSVELYPAWSDYITVPEPLKGERAAVIPMSITMIHCMSRFTLYCWRFLRTSSIVYWLNLVLVRIHHCSLFPFLKQHQQDQPSKKCTVSNILLSQLIHSLPRKDKSIHLIRLPISPKQTGSNNM